MACDSVLPRWLPATPRHHHHQATMSERQKTPFFFVTEYNGMKRERKGAVCRQRKRRKRVDSFSPLFIVFVTIVFEESVKKHFSRTASQLRSNSQLHLADRIAQRRRRNIHNNSNIQSECGTGIRSEMMTLTATMIVDRPVRFLKSIYCRIYRSDSPPPPPLR